MTMMTEARSHLVDAPERVQVGGAVPRDRGVADRARQRRPGVMAGSLLEVVTRRAFDERHRVEDAGDRDHSLDLAVGRRRRRGPGRVVGDRGRRDLVHRRGCDRGGGAHDRVVRGRVLPVPS